MHTMFNEQDLQQQQRIKCTFDPHGRLNPGKMFPVLRRCAELGKLHVHKGNIPFPDIPRVLKFMFYPQITHPCLMHAGTRINADERQFFFSVSSVAFLFLCLATEDTEGTENIE